MVILIYLILIDLFLNKFDKLITKNKIYQIILSIYNLVHKFK
jgi:hypothetical protein